MIAHDVPEEASATLLTTAGAVIAPEQPYDLLRPTPLSTPLIFSSPHSGRLYPSDMMDAAVLDADAIRRSEDVLVDCLVTDAPRPWRAAPQRPLRPRLYRREPPAL